MTGPTYTFSAGINATVSAEMEDSNNRVKNELNDLHSDLQTQLTHWQSATSKAQYEAHKAKWDAAAAQMPLSLSAASQTLQEITSLLRSTDNNIGGIWGG